jgi:beta-lactamase class A
MIHFFRFFLLLFPVLAIALLAMAIIGGAGSPAARVALGPPEPPVIKTPEERDFEQRLEEIGASLDGKVGIAVIDVATGRAYHANGEEALPQQSVSKLWVAMAALGMVDKGKLDLAEDVVIRREDLTLFHQPIREMVSTDGYFASTYADLMRRALTQSDNAANDRLLRRVGGPEKVQDWLDESGISGVRFGVDERTKQSAIAGLEWRQTYSMQRRFYDARDRVPGEIRRAAFEAYLADPIDGASALGIARALAAMARGDLLSESSTALLRATLETTKSGPNRLKAGVPAGWVFEHKTGTGQVLEGEQSGYNDVGVMTAPDGTQYAVAVMIGRTRESNPRRMEMMQKVSRAVGAFHENRGKAEWRAT